MTQPISLNSPNDNPTLVVVRSSPPANSAKNEGRTPNSFARLAIVTGVLLPIAIVPYILSRRRIVGLQRRCEELQLRLSVLERRLNAGVSKVTSVRDEQGNMRAILHEMGMKMDEMQEDAMQRSARQSQTNQLIHSDLRHLLKETKQIRSHTTSFRALGVSLADVAAFMHEIELQMGLQSGADNDKRGIHRLRILALQMQNLSQKEKCKVCTTAIQQGIIDLMYTD
ncbi:hypothetical protein P691DRAFT_661552 [Macrolepiota fuliginosa MF-IS2]|uniref:Uncharacterized protein n=1 Tax=Macrolepiota fuliginosa MF-IS2 TaxID=1400762 RepID=A0A9P5XN76_9AGAR|nr:hypothetical protein P691DRAFT_661552 [Macrolepiota fuliginosa MF-IS2]